MRTKHRVPIYIIIAIGTSLLLSCTNKAQRPDITVSTDSKEGIFDVQIVSEERTLIFCGFLRNDFKRHFLSNTPETISKISAITYYSDKSADEQIKIEIKKELAANEDGKIFIHIESDKRNLTINEQQQAN